jgi:hypothetical protein
MIQPKKQMLNMISLVIEQRKNEFDRIAKVRSTFPVAKYKCTALRPLSKMAPSALVFYNRHQVNITSIELFIYIQTCVNVNAYQIKK